MYSNDSKIKIVPIGTLFQQGFLEPPFGMSKVPQFPSKRVEQFQGKNRTIFFSILSPFSRGHEETILLDALEYYEQFFLDVGLDFSRRVAAEVLVDLLHPSQEFVRDFLRTSTNTPNDLRSVSILIMTEIIDKAAV